MGNSTLDVGKFDAYAAQAKEVWGATQEYKEFEEKTAGRAPSELEAMGRQLMDVLAEFGTLKETNAASDPAVQAQVEKLQSFISEHFYTCTKEVLAGLGALYAACGEFTANIDGAGGDGTAAFVHEAIQAYCG